MRKKRKLRARAQVEAKAQADALASIAGDRVEAEAGEDGRAAAGEAAHEYEYEDVHAHEDVHEDVHEDGNVYEHEHEDGSVHADGDVQADPAGADPDSHLEEVQAMSPARLKVIVESLLFAGDKPLTVPQLKQLTGVRDGAAIQAALDALAEDYRDRGIVLHDVAGGYQFRTHPSSSEYVQRLIAGRPVRLSRAQLETLAIIAYRQPVTRPEIDEIRGVDCGSTLKVLLDRDLIRVLGKKEEPGRPLLYGSTREFLEFFNLRDLRELPTLREFHELSEESLREVEKLDKTAEAEPGEEAGQASAAGHSESAQAEAGAEPDVEPDDDDGEDQGGGGGPVAAGGDGSEEDAAAAASA